MKYLVALLVACLGIGVLAAPLDRRENEPAQSVLKPETIKAIEAIVLSSNIPGMSIAITTKDKDEILSFGNASIFGDPVDEDTWWSIGSNSKQLTAIIFAMLSEQKIPLENGNVYKLDTPLIEFMPNFKMYDDNATQQATTLDLLSHSTGLPTHNYLINDTVSTKDYYDLLPYLPPTAPFRSLYQYSSLNYAAAGYILEYLTGRDYYDLLQEMVFDKAGLTANTNLSETIATGKYSNGFYNAGINATQCAIDTEALSSNDTESSEAAGAGSRSGPTPAGPEPDSCFGRLEAFESYTKGVLGRDYGAGGAVNFKATDLLRWARAMTHAEGIPQSIIDIVDTPRFRVDNVTEHNMGSYTVQRGDDVMVYHGGSVLAHSSIFGRIPDKSIGVYLITNSVSFAASANSIMYNLVLDDLLGIPAEPTSAASGEASESEGGAEDSSSSSGTGGSGEPASGTPPPPTDPRPSPPFEDLLTTYSHPAYGNITLSTLDLDDPSALEAIGLPLQAFEIDLKTAYPYGEQVFTGQALYAYYNRLLAEHIIFTHFDGPLFNWTIVNTYPSLDVQEGEDAKLGQLLGQGSALFEDGKLGMYTWVLGEESLPPVAPEEGNVDGAEIVFASV